MSETKTKMVIPSREPNADWAYALAPFMFGVSFLFLFVLAGLIVVTVNMPRMDSMADLGTSGSQATAAWDQLEDATGLANYFLIALVGVWVLFPIEFVIKYAVRDKTQPFWSKRKVDMCAVLCPPIRLAMPSSEMNGQLWLPRIGWELPGKQLQRRLEKIFSTPMLLIALLILPVLLVEFGLSSLVERNQGLRTTLHVCTGLIWFAFTLEFIVMISATDRRFRYVKKNWIDLAIILLPLISFLRSLRIVRAARVARFAKVQQLAKMTRVYRMRGLLAKTVRALLLFEIVHRILRVTPKKRLKRLQEQLKEKIEETDEIRDQIRSLKKRIAIDKANDKANDNDKAKKTEVVGASEEDDDEEPPAITDPTSADQSPRAA